MGLLRYSINLTIDGCCDHSAMTPDEELHLHAAANIARADALILGRITYEMMKTAWRPLAESGAREEWMTDWMLPFAHTIHKARKYVVSDTLDQVDWNTELVRGDNIKDKILELKKQSKKGLFVGGVKLPLTLTEFGLIDEYEFIIHPRIAGHGPNLFEGLSKQVDLNFVGQHQFKSGAVSMRYVLKS